MPRHAAANDDDDGAPSGRCPLCVDTDPNRRAAHHLSLVHVADLGHLRSHVTEQYVKFRESQRARPELVDDICAWAGTVIEQYSGLANPVTGAKLCWWDARAYMVAQRSAIAQSAYTRAPEGYKARPETAAPLVRQTPRYEPGDDDPSTI